MCYLKQVTVQYIFASHHIQLFYNCKLNTEVK